MALPDRAPGAPLLRLAALSSATLAGGPLPLATGGFASDQDSVAGNMINSDWDVGTLAARWLSWTVYGFALKIDLSRPAGPAYEQAKARFNSIVKPAPREEIALRHLFLAARQSGSVEADVADVEGLARRAVELLVEGSDHTQKWDRWFNADIEAAIKALLGLKERSEVHDYPYTTNNTENGDQSSAQLEIW